MICEECEEDHREIYCEDCKEYFCKRCDRFIHKKGKRVEHNRIRIDKRIESFKMLMNIIYIEVQKDEKGGFAEEKLRYFLKEIKEDLDFQFKQTIFLSNLDVNIFLKGESEPIKMMNIGKLNIRDFLMKNFGEEVNLNFVVLFKKKREGDEILVNNLSESYQFCQIHYNINLFKFINCIEVSEDKKEKILPKKKSYSDLKKSQKLDQPMMKGKKLILIKFQN